MRNHEKVIFEYSHPGRGASDQWPQDPGPAAKLNVGYPAGPTAYFNYLDGWRTSGEFEGLAFRK